MTTVFDTEKRIEPIQVFESEDDGGSGDLLIEQGLESVEIEEENHQKLLKYLRDRLDAGARVRTPRIQRFASIDQMMSTWQKLSPEDTKRENREEATGRQQALPINIPLAQAHVEDAVAFFTEVFAPIGGNFFTSPGQRNKIGQVKLLTQKMEQDMKQSTYYSGVVSTMNALCKYNVGGFWLEWVAKSRLSESDGNVLRSIDMYNLLYDPAITDVSTLHKEGEWAAIPEVKSRLWLIRNAEKLGLINLESVFKRESIGADGSSKMDVNEQGKAVYYKSPPSQTRMNANGRDSGTSIDGEREHQVDWNSYGLGLAEDRFSEIEGYEVVTVYAWINPEQFDFERTDESSLVELWEFKICDAKWIISAKSLQGAVELPVYLSRMKKDEMEEALRSLAEHIRPFQRFVSFLLNTHLEGIRKNIWGFTVYDPKFIDPANIMNGETSGLIAMKQTGDARMALQKIDSKPDTYTNVQTAGDVMNLLKTIFPNQAMPAQIAGMDRAVSSQVSAVLQGAMRRMHMLVRAIDSMLMLPVRMGMYRNIAMFDPDKSKLTGITPEEVAELLASGLGQINREAAAEQVRTIIFALIQNPEGAAMYDLPGLLELWSILLNIGTDLSEFYKTPPAGQAQQVDENGIPISADPNASSPMPSSPMPGGAAGGF